MSKSFSKVLARYSSAQVISNFLRLASGFMVVRLIEPELYGKYSGVAIYLGYILLGQGGIVTGLRRELPFELGRGNEKYARELASSTFVLSLLISILAALIFLISALYQFYNDNILIGFIFLSYIIIAGTYFLNKQFLPTLYRTNNDFDSLSKQNIRLGVANLFSVVFVYFFSIYGLILRGVLLALFEFYLLFKNKPFQLSISYKWSHFLKLFKVGLPIFIVGQVRPLWSTIQKNILFSAGGALQFGYYALVGIINGAIGVIPASFSQVVYPRMAIQHGKGLGKNEVLSQIKKPTIFQFSLMLIIAIMGAISLPYIIPALLPKYINGITAAQWAFFIPVVQSLGLANNYFNVVKKQKFYFISLLTGAAIGLSYVLLRLHFSGFDLVYFPQGIIIGSLIQIILSLYFLLFKLKDD